MNKTHFDPLLVQHTMHCRFYVRCPKCDAPPLHMCDGEDFNEVSHLERLAEWTRQGGPTSLPELQMAMLKAASSE